MTGSSFDLVVNLQEDLRSLKDTHRPDQVVRIVQGYWDNKSNQAARESHTDAEAAARNTVNFCMEFCLPPSTSCFSIGLAPVVQGAEKGDQIAIEALKELVTAWLSHAGDLPPEIRDIGRDLLQDKYKATRRGARSSPAIYHRGLQLALVVFSVRKIFGSKYSLEGRGLHRNNIFGLVEEATGVDFDIVKKSWQAHKNDLPK